MTAARQADHPINPLFLERWSPRSYDPAPMPAQDLNTILEAARWAPSAYNIQPWRFLYAHRDDIHWEKYVSLLDPFNAGWAKHASALVFILSDTLTPADTGRPAKKARNHSFDAGAAWAQLALQATSLGYQAHAMAGIHYDKIHAALTVPEHFRVEIAVAIGKQAEPSHLPENLQEREYPSHRKPVTDIAFAGVFPHD